MSHKGTGGWKERRGGKRAKTQRRVIFGAPAAMQPFREGVAVDIGPTGLRLLAKTPLTVGMRLELRIYPRPEDARGEILSLTGRVVWRLPAPNGHWLAGIWTPLDRPRQGASKTPLSSKEARALIEDIAKDLGNRDANLPPLTVLAPAITDTIPLTGTEKRTPLKVEFRSEEEEREDSSDGMPLPWYLRRGCSAALTGSALAALLLVCLGIFLRGCGCAPLETRRDSGTVAEAPAPATALTSALPPAAVPPEEARNASPSNETLHDTLGRAQGDLAAGTFAAAQDDFLAILAHDALPPVVRFAALLGQAQSEHGLGEAGKALETLGTALSGAEAGGVPPEWIQAARDYRKLVASGTPLLLAAHVLQEAVDLERLEDEGEPAGELIIEAEPEMGTDDTAAREGEAPLLPERLEQPYIEVDTESFLLTVFDEMAPVAVFPVGLGCADTTPHGDFHIANKIENPDWFDRGRVVKAGDPANQLGAYWLGLGNEAGATSYGIHPTQETDSIGKKLSRGCIRMRPGDAAKVFQWCDVGTRVHIGP